MLDARSTATGRLPPARQPVGRPVHPGACSELAAPSAAFGWQQEAWLQQGLAQDGREHAARWSVLAQQTCSPRHYLGASCPPTAGTATRPHVHAC